jgi:hypothetical protein
MMWNCHACTFANSMDDSSGVKCARQFDAIKANAQSQEGCLQPSGAIQALDLKPPLKLNKSEV